MAEGEGGTGRAQGAQNTAGGVTSERESYTVYRGKEAWAEELFAACRRLGLPPDRKGRPNLRALAKRIGKSEYSLIARIGSPGDPDLETLRLLESKGGVPRVRSLLALGEITRAQVATELGIDPASVPDVPLAVRRLMQSWTALPGELARDLLDAMRAVLEQDSGDNTPGPSPRAADPP